MDVKLVRTCVKVAKAWVEFGQTGQIPELVEGDYQEIFLYGKWPKKREKYEPKVKEVLKEFVALSLFRELSDAAQLAAPWASPYNASVSYEAWLFPRLHVAYTLGHVTHRRVNKYYQDVSVCFTNRGIITKRLTDTCIDLIKLSVDKSQLDSLAEAFGLAYDGPSDFCKPICQLRDGQWWVDLTKWCELALSRLNLMIEHLPNPDSIPCQQAIRWLVEMYDQEPDKPYSPIMTLDQATMADHIATCQGDCYDYRDCVNTVIRYNVIRKYSDPEGDNDQLIETARQQLAASPV